MSEINEKIKKIKGDRLLVTVIDESKENENGIILSMDNPDHTSRRGIVSLIGDTCSDSELIINDEVLYNVYSATRVTISGIDYDVIPTNEILLILK
jgi:co-chaperonin GroES (HSP10)